VEEDERHRCVRRAKGEERRRDQSEKGGGGKNKEGTE